MGPLIIYKNKTKLTIFSISTKREYKVCICWLSSLLPNTSSPVTQLLTEAFFFKPCTTPQYNLPTPQKIFTIKTYYNERKTKVQQLIPHSKHARRMRFPVRGDKSICIRNGMLEGFQMHLSSCCFKIGVSWRWG